YKEIIVKKFKWYCNYHLYIATKEVIWLSLLITLMIHESYKVELFIYVFVPHTVKVICDVLFRYLMD
ncbi:hypothetical protein Lal_00038235, partial [Lupinus albus]